MARDGEPPGRATARTAATGIVAALPVLVLVVLGAAGPRPPVTGDGAWTTPLQILLGVAGIALLLVLALVLLGMGGGAPRAPRPRRSRLLVAFALLVVAIVVVPQLEFVPPPPLEAGFLGLESSLEGPPDVAPRPVSPTAVTAGLAALAAVAALALLLARRDGGTRRRLHEDGVAAGATGPAPPPDLAGSPTEVVLAAYAIGRTHVVQALGVGDHDPPRRLLTRAAGTPHAEQLQVLTDLHLPIRYGRRQASAGQAAAAVAALERLTGRSTADTGGPDGTGDSTGGTASAPGAGGTGGTGDADGSHLGGGR